MPQIIHENSDNLVSHLKVIQLNNVKNILCKINISMECLPDYEKLQNIEISNASDGDEVP